MRRRFPCWSGDEVHVTVLRRTAFPRLGQERVSGSPSMRMVRSIPLPLRLRLRTVRTPALVCAQAGNVNTVRAIRWTRSQTPRRRTMPGCTSTEHSACGPLRRPASSILSPDASARESWAVDAHKWLNIPYDCALVNRQPSRLALRRDGAKRRISRAERPA